MDDPKPRNVRFFEINEAMFAKNVKQVERDLLGFLEILKSWGEHEEISKPGRLVDAVDKAFAICPEYMKTDWWKKQNQ